KNRQVQSFVAGRDSKAGSICRAKHRDRFPPVSATVFRFEAQHSRAACQSPFPRLLSANQPPGHTAPAPVPRVISTPSHLPPLVAIRCIATPPAKSLARASNNSPPFTLPPVL